MKSYSRDKRSLGDCDARIDTLQEVFANLATLKPKYIEYPREDLHAGRHSITVKMLPVGIEMLPQNETDLKDALRCMLCGLQELHGLGWLHSDVRWPNLLWKTVGHWFLVDLDRAVKMTDRSPNDDLKHAAQRLFIGLPFCLSHEATEFALSLAQASTATDALSHSYLLALPS